MNKQKILTKNIDIVYKFCHSEKNRNYQNNFDSFEDFISEMVLEAYEKIENWDPQRGALSTFLYKILSIKCFKSYNKKHRGSIWIVDEDTGRKIPQSMELSLEYLGELADTYVEDGDVELFDRLLDNTVSDRLKEFENLLIYKRHYEDTRTEDLAQERSCSSTNINNRIEREKRRITNLYDSEEDFLFYADSKKDKEIKKFDKSAKNT